MSSKNKHWKLGILGGPDVGNYSLSPQMHRAALHAAGLKGEYKAYPVKPENLSAWLEKEAFELDGFNVTMPHKEVVAQWAAEHPKTGMLERLLAKGLGSVNTVSIRNGRLAVVSTDGAGFLRGLSEKVPLKRLRGASVLLLGAGGAAQVLASALTTAQTENRELVGIGLLHVWNRTSERAKRLAEKINSPKDETSCSARAVEDLSEIDFEKIDFIVNATAAGMRGSDPLEMPAGSLRKEQVVCDIVYDPKETPLIRSARQAGCTVVTGDAMLAGQGAEAFRFWTGVDEMYPAMKTALEKKWNDCCA